jgi:outer membrane protein
MNKNISLALNVVLTIAVAVLYYLHFTSSATCTAEGGTGTDSASSAKTTVILPKEIKASKIVYVNTDVLNDNYEYVKDLTAEAKKKQMALEGIYQKKGKELQDRYQELQQKASQGLLSENQQKEAQQELEKRKNELDQLQGQQQQMMEQLQVENMKVYKSITEYVGEYNKNSKYNYILAYSATTVSPVLIANDSLDITAEILEGLNAQYKARKGK